MWIASFQDAIGDEKIKVSTNPRWSQSQTYPKIYRGGGAIF
jgi:hypothetical protein